MRTKQQRMRENATLLTEGKRICATCDEIKSLDDFYSGPPIPSSCKECTKARTRSAMRLKRSLWTEEEYLAAYERQKGICPICKEHFPVLVGDHCHTSNMQRELLCNNCNVLIGMAHENIDILESAITYLRKHFALLENYL